MPSAQFTPNTLPGQAEKSQRSLSSEAKSSRERSAEIQRTAGEFFRNTDDPSDKPLSVFEEVSRRPYISDVLKVSDVWQGDKDEARMKLGVIDYYLKKELEKRQWLPTTSAYKEVFKEVSKELKLSKNLANVEMMNRVFHYLNLRRYAYGE